MNIERILCPVDFSPLSQLALHHAASVASWYGAHVDLLHVIVEPLPPWSPRMGPAPAPVADDVRLQIAAALHEWAAELDLHESRVSEAVAVGAPPARIVEHASATRADLIVLGTHGRSGVQQFLLGSTAERVVSLASCPVLTIPPRAHEPPSASHVQFKRILCAVDFSPASLRAFQHGVSLAQENDGRLTLLHAFETLTESEAHASAHFRVAEYVRTRKGELREQLQALVTTDARAWCEAEALVELGLAAPTILRVARDIGADLIVMGAQGHSGLGLRLFGSATQTVVRRAVCPVLTARAEES
jgi:nucleotide-binding universal stress UspA family protein